MTFALTALGAQSPLKSGPVKPTSVGPTSSAEAEILWEDGKKAFDASEFSECADRLQRLVDRYPAFAQSHSAHFILGKSWLELGRADKALPPLKYFVESSNPESAPSARLWLGRAYLDLHKFHEAYLLTLEKNRGLAPEIETENLLIKSRALMGMKQDDRATQSIQSARKLAPQNHDLVDKIDLIDLQLKLRACAKYAAAKQLAEDQARSQIESRGVCLLEAVSRFKDPILAMTGAQTQKQATQELSTAFQAYTEVCAHPPDPTPLRPKPRTREQLIRYRHELAAQLREDCGKKSAAASRLIKGTRLDGAIRLNPQTTAKDPS